MANLDSVWLKADRSLAGELWDICRSEEMEFAAGAALWLALILLVAAIG